MADQASMSCAPGGAPRTGRQDEQEPFAELYGPWPLVAGASEGNGAFVRVLPARNVVVVLPALSQNAPDGVAEWVRTEVRARAIDGIVIVPCGTASALANLSNRVTWFDGALEAMDKSPFREGS